MGKTKKVRYTFDVTRYKMQKNGIPSFVDMKEVSIDADNYIVATIKMDKDYPPDKYVKQLTHTSDGSWPKSYTLWPSMVSPRCRQSRSL